MQKVQKMQKVAEDGGGGGKINNAWTLDITRLGLVGEGGVRAK